MPKQRVQLLSLVLVLGATCLLSANVFAQGGQTLFGDIRVTADNNTIVPKEVTLILRRVPDGEVGRQTISSRGRYRFTNLTVGEYEILVEADGKEIGRLQTIMIRNQMSNSPYGHQYDLDFRWRPSGASTPAAGVVAAGDFYERPSANRSLFQRAEEFVTKKKYDDAVDLLKQVVETDKNDFQAWTALGIIYAAQEKPDDADSQKKFDAAVEPLTKAIELQPTNGDANYLLGETYLQLKKGSKAIPYLNEAANLGRPDAHLRLGWLYNAAGMKDKAALEYEEYLKKNPTYPERDKLKEYIANNKKS
jgi:Tfp pilus assembly protein PilF